MPDCRSLGVLARALLTVNALAAVAALARAPDLGGLPAALVDVMAVVEPPLVLTLLLLYLAAPALRGWPWPRFAAAVLALAAAVSLGLYAYLGAAQRELMLPGGAARALLWSQVAAALTLYYLYLRAKAFSPALAEARVMALTARIRPHFLFNSLNAVLGTMRDDPRRAEEALEELSDLFRVLMAENRDLVPVAGEIELARQYLDLEKLRLGSRLDAVWTLEDCPPDALVPPLMLQPLLENAVYHGVEPAAEKARIDVRIARHGDELRIDIANPYHGAGSHHAGNRMALANIRERLALFFDLQARLDTVAEDGLYRVSIRIPCRRAR